MHIFIDEPVSYQFVRGLMVVRGWVAGNQKIDRILVTVGEDVVQADIFDRADVEIKLDGECDQVCGFRCEVECARGVGEQVVEVSVYSSDNLVKEKHRRILVLKSDLSVDPDSQLVVLHIPKTAGTTLRGIVDDVYGDRFVYPIYEKNDVNHDFSDFLKLSNEEKAKIRCFIGHVHYGLHAHIDGGPGVQYLSVLRDPVSRVVSLYRHIIGTSWHPLYDDVMGMSVADFVVSGVTKQTNNHQARVISGKDCEYGECDNSMLIGALKNIASPNFAVLGLTERFDDTYRLIRSMFNWPKLDYKTRNVSKGEALELSARDTDAIIEYNELDIELYKRGEQLFDLQIDQILKP